MKKILLMLTLLISAVFVSCNSKQKTIPAVDDSIVEEVVIDTICSDSCTCDTVCIDTCVCE